MKPNAILHVIQEKNMLILSVIAVFVFAMLTSAEVMAATGMGSISVKLSSENKSDTAQISLVQIADQTNDEPALRERYQDTGVVLNELKTAEATQKAAKLLMEKAGTPLAVKKVNAGKQVRFEELAEGVYLIYESGNEAMLPALVTIPMEVDGAMVHDVMVTAKYEARPETDEPPETTYQTGTWLYPIHFLCCGVICLLLSIGYAKKA